MALIGMRAEFRCDECGSLFSVSVCTGEALTDRASSEVVEDALSEGNGYKGPAGFSGTSRTPSILPDGMHLCGACTSKADEAMDESPDEDSGELSDEDEAEAADHLRHLAEHDRWASLTDRERGDEIRRAMG
jgi:hypothetical protein